GYLQWGHLIDPLTRQVERFAAGGQHLHAMAGAEQALGHVGRTIQEMLTIVEHDEHLTITYRSDDRLERVLVLRRDPDGAGDLDRDAGKVVQIRQAHEPTSFRKSFE